MYTLLRMSNLFASSLLKHALFAAAISGACMATPAVGRDDVSTQEVQRWLDAEVERSREYPAIVGLVVEFDQLYHPKVTQAELEALRIEIQGKPDHPARREMASHERRLATGPDRKSWKVWLLTTERWRVNGSNEFPTGIPFVDYGRDGNDAWVLMDDSMVVIDADKPPPNRNYSREESLVRMHLDEFLYAGLGQTRGEAAFSHLAIEGDRWSVRRTVTLAPESEVVVELAGRWDADAERGFVERRTLIASPFGAPGRRWDFSGWRHEPLLKSWVCGRVDEIAPDGRPHESFVWRGVAPVTAQEVEALIAVPDPLGEDPVRGIVKVRAVSDFRAKAMTFTALDDEGASESRSLTTSAPRQNIQWMGWALAALIIAGLVFMRVRRGSQVG